VESGPAELDFVIVGAQKSASTFVHRCLMRHPQIDIPSEESRNFEDPFYARGGVEDLERLFGARAEHVRRGIKRPDYLADPAVPGRLARAAAEVRLVAVLRDPVPRAVSAYFHYVRLGFLPPEPLDRGFQQILDGTLQPDYPRAADVIRYGMYGAHLTRYLEHFDRDRLLVLLQQDIRSDPETQVSVLLEFLEVSTKQASNIVSSTSAANTGTYDMRRIRVQRSRNRFMFDYSEDMYRRSPKTRISPVGFLIAGAATVLDERILARFDRTVPPRMSAHLEARLRDVYADDTVVLRSLLGRQVWD
jgi:hypothetical protein